MQIKFEMPDPYVAWLDRNAAADGKSRDELIFDVLREYMSKQFKIAAEQAFGAWKGRTDIGDSVEYVRKLRSEWDRDWDMPDADAPPRSEAAE